MVGTQRQPRSDTVPVPTAIGVTDRYVRAKGPAASLSNYEFSNCNSKNKSTVSIEQVLLHLNKTMQHQSLVTNSSRVAHNFAS